MPAYFSGIEYGDYTGYTALSLTEWEWFGRSALTNYYDITQSTGSYYGWKTTCDTTTNLESNYLWHMLSPGYNNQREWPQPQILVRDSTQVRANADAAAERYAVRLAETEAQLKAKLKARTLLRRVLTKGQWEEFDSTGHVTITAQSGRRYRLSGSSQVRNVSLLDNQNKVVEVLCAHPIMNVPIEDVLVTQKLHLEFNENAFRAVANISPGHGLRPADLARIVEIIPPDPPADNRLVHEPIAA